MQHQSAKRHIHRVLLLGLLAVLASGCKVTAEDIETWKGTIKGPGKIVAVILSEHYSVELRTQAALALIEMPTRPAPHQVNGLAEMQAALLRVPEETRVRIIEGMVPGLESLMRGDGTPPVEGRGVPEEQARGKDAAYLLVASVRGDMHERLVRAVIGWYVVDFNGRNLAGSYSAEQIIRSLGAQAAGLLVDALNAQMPQPALVKLAQLIGQLGSDETKARAATRLVEIQRHMEGDEFLGWLKNKVREALLQAHPDQTPDAARIDAVATLNREKFINEGALPAMKHLASAAVVQERLVAIAEIASAEPYMIDRRTRSLLALEGNVGRPHLERLLSLALNNDNPVAVRDNAFDRVGDIRSPDAIPPLWPLVENATPEGQRLRWRAGEMILAIGGPGVVAEFFRRLPSASDIAYEPEELEGYATRMSQMTPLPTRQVRGQLSANQWWKRVIALRYFQRRARRNQLRYIRRLRRDDTHVAGQHWANFQITTVGQVATEALTAAQQRLSGGATPQGSGQGAAPTQDSGTAP